ncbi:MAG TPA: DNA-deoxyinosine glycosylase [Geomonas sp.]|nr:DNA-deoxyinosine glycosylase [Geomonas sp.]
MVNSNKAVDRIAMDPRPVTARALDGNEMKKHIEHIEGLPPVVGPSPKVLILGTFPGEESLRQNQYYAHPRNLFWEIMGQVCGAGRDIKYEDRLNILKNSQIALWDVLKSCSRHGSLDTDIRNGFYEVNDFKKFLAEHDIKAICFNGKKAEELFKKIPASTLPELPMLSRLPSTSPANAGIPKDTKICQWLLIKKHLECAPTRPVDRSQ